MVKITVETICDYCGRIFVQVFTGRTPDYIDSNDFWLSEEEGHFDYIESDDYGDKLFCSLECYRKQLSEDGKLEDIDE